MQSPIWSRHDGMRWLPAGILCALAVAMAGCGDSNSATTSTTVTSSQPTTTVAAPSGPMVRICDRSLARQVRGSLRSNGFDEKLRPPTPTGNQRNSRCDFAKVVELSIDNAPDAVQRYQNRVVETAQFSESIPSHVPRPLRGIGDRRLGAAGANWIAFLHQLLSARGKRVLIVTVNGAGTDSERLSAAKAITFDVYDRLGSDA
jgi:hypothetical protein